MSIAVIVLAGLSATLSGVLIVLHALKPKSVVTKDLDLVHDKLDALAAVLKSMVPPAVALLLVLHFTACSANTRATTLHASLAAVDAAGATLLAYGPPHELALAQGAGSHEEREAAVKSWQAERTKAEQALEGAYRLCALASLADDKSSLDAATKAVQLALDQLRGMGVVK